MNTFARYFCVQTTNTSSDNEHLSKQTTQSRCQEYDELTTEEESQQNVSFSEEDDSLNDIAVIHFLKILKNRDW